jgi:hypothetical protein
MDSRAEDIAPHGTPLRILAPVHGRRHRQGGRCERVREYHDANRAGVPNGRSGADYPNDAQGDARITGVLRAGFLAPVIPNTESFPSIWGKGRLWRRRSQDYSGFFLNLNEHSWAVGIRRLSVGHSASGR